MTTSHQKKKIAILGGGMASLTAAYEITNEPDWQSRYEITLYQMGWRLGGKGASGRNLANSARIEEHGLHIFMGMYENTFGLMRRCYEELGRPSDAPLATWQDAFKPHGFTASPENINGQWIPWAHDFPANDLVPGDGHEFPTVMGYIGILIEFMIDQFNHSSWSSEFFAPDEPGVEVSKLLEELPSWLVSVLAEAKIPVNAPQFPEQIAFLEIANQLVQALSPDPRDHTDAQHQAILWLLKKFRDWLLESVEAMMKTHHKFRRLGILVDLAHTVIRGIFVDKLVFKGFDVIDEYDFQEWLGKHGALEISIHSVPVRGIYDLVFGYENGDINQPNLAAGASLRSMLRLMFSYRGAFFWKMQAGMGDTIFAPFYEVLKQRGVIFKFFHSVLNLELAADQKSIAAIKIGRQVTLKNKTYDPLVHVKGLPCWPSTPLYEQLAEGEMLQEKGINLESAWMPWENREEIMLKAGDDFDTVVLGISLGALKFICPELIAAQERWQLMLEKVKTIQTQALQVWLKPDIAQLGWNMPSPIVDAYVHPLNTWADMSHLNQVEDWTPEHFPGNIAYFCGPLEDAPEIPATQAYDFPEQQGNRVKATAKQWFENNIPTLWPKIMDAKNNLNWQLLIDPQHRQGEKRFDAQFWKSNIEPSDRYVLSVKGSTKYRLRSDQSGFENLFLAGDWTLNNFNLGCIEATVISGMHVSQAISGYPTKIVGESDI